MPKVLISDKLSPKAVEIFESHNVEVDVKVGMTPEELKACIGEYDGLAIRSATKVTEEIIEAATNLKVVGRAGIGVDNVDIPAASAKGIVVMNTPFGNSITTAEHSIALMMSLARSISQADVSTQAGKWEKSKFMGSELSGKTLGLIGCGNIGSIVADRAQGLKMKVVVYDPYLSEDHANNLNIEKIELDDLLARADFISLHTPLNDSTRGIIDAKAIEKMKPTARIINCARGGLVNEEDLRKALDEGKIAGAAFDVFSEEPAKENVLFGSDKLVATPHLGASTSEAQENVALQVAEQISDYLTVGTVTNALNIPSVSAEDAQKLKPYLELVEKLGGFVGQMTETGIKGIKIEYEGGAAELNTKPLTSVALKGVLSPLITEVNMVNAPVIAKSREIEVAEIKHDRKGDYQTMIRITLQTEKRERSIAGTLFGNQPRLLEMHGVKLEAGLGKYMLYVNNEDKPGLIGDLGKLLGDEKVNIANFHLGRNDDQSDAVALLELDQEVSADALDRINTLASVKQAKLIKF